MLIFTKIILILPWCNQSNKEQNMQGILGLHPRKPYLYVEFIESKNVLNIYWGIQHFTTIANDPDSFEYRHLVARLAMANIFLSTIAEAFEIDARTVKRYRNVLENSSTDQEMFDNLMGLHRKKTKLTPEVTIYIELRFRAIYPENRKNYNKTIRQEVQERFDIKLSTEAVRQVIAPIREQLDATANQTNDESENTTQVETIENTNQTAITENEILPQEPEVIEVEAIEIPQQGTGRDDFFQCAGLLVLNAWVQSFFVTIKDQRACLIQWLYQIFWGAVNFEQARYWPRHEIETFTATTSIGVSRSREILGQIAYQEFDAYVQQLFEINLSFLSEPLEPHKVIYYYIDGHFDPYYGEVKILKGWSNLMHRAHPGTEHYVVHNIYGDPVFTEVTDFFLDFREYIEALLPRLQSFSRQSTQQTNGLIFDRGAFSELLFGRFDRAGVCFITWEKDFKVPDESQMEFTDSLTLLQPRNEVGDYTEEVIDYLETSYLATDGYTCRKFIIRRKTSEGYFYASILSNDRQTHPESIITLILTRWCQENDFKYQKKHFGLDQITAYDFEQVPLASQIQIQNGTCEALEKQVEDLKQQRSQLLEQLGCKRLTKKKRDQINNAVPSNNAHLSILTQIDHIDGQLKKIQKLLTKEKNKLKRLKKIETNEYYRLDLRKKQIFDQLRLIARNIFYRAIDEFQAFYPNLRDLHQVFRDLTRSPGFIDFEKNQVVVQLVCNFTGRALKAVEKFCQALNAKSVKFIDGSDRPIIFKVHSKLANCLDNR
jgi:hypothetical protein